MEKVNGTKKESPDEKSPRLHTKHPYFYFNLTSPLWVKN